MTLYSRTETSRRRSTEVLSSVPFLLPCIASFLCNVKTKASMKLSGTVTTVIINTILTISEALYHPGSILIKTITYSSSILSNPNKAPSISLLIPLRCIFNDFKESKPWKVRLSITLIRFLLSSLKANKKPQQHFNTSCFNQEIANTSCSLFLLRDRYYNSDLMWAS